MSDGPQGMLAKIGMWMAVLGGMFGPFVVALFILKGVAPVWFQSSDWVVFVAGVIASAFWLPLRAVAKQSRFRGSRHLDHEFRRQFDEEVAIETLRFFAADDIPSVDPKVPRGISGVGFVSDLEGVSELAAVEGRLGRAVTA
jgi:hypothetical protein